MSQAGAAQGAALSRVHPHRRVPKLEDPQRLRNQEPKTIAADSYPPPSIAANGEIGTRPLAVPFQPGKNEKEREGQEHGKTDRGPVPELPLP